MQDKAETAVGRQKLIRGDCLDVLDRWPEARFDIVVTSPPYNLNLAYQAYDDSRAEADYIAWLVKVAAGIKRALKPSGSFFLNITGSNSRPYIPFELMVRLRHEAGFHLQNHITWIKSIGMGTASSGHFKPVPGRRFMHHNHEHIFHLTHHGTVELDRLAIGLPFQDKSNIPRRGHPRDLRCRGNTWFIPYSTVKSKAQKFWHPATFPVELPLWCIYLHGQPNVTVLDPFLGAGTTLVAACLAGARGVGIDIDPAYVATAGRRLRETVEGFRVIALDPTGMAALFRAEALMRDAGVWQRRFSALVDRLNKTTGRLPLLSADIAAIRKLGVRAGRGGWERLLFDTFEPHLGPAAHILGELEAA